MGRWQRAKSKGQRAKGKGHQAHCMELRLSGTVLSPRGFQDPALPDGLAIRVRDSAGPTGEASTPGDFGSVFTVGLDNLEKIRYT
jgi:hypothetical protein